jgi:hypothetical protein
MNVATSLLDAQVAALLRRLSREQEMRTRRAGDDAGSQAQDILRRARSEARARVHQAVVETRRENEHALARRRAAIDTRQRRARQATIRKLLDEAWQQLPEALAERWSQLATREGWCRAACHQALRCLLDVGQVQVELDAEHEAALAPVLREELSAAPHMEIHGLGGFGPGLRIRAGNALLDATIGGLLAARERVAAELLAEFDRPSTPESLT